jgi:two-component system, chemotaxis family, response regulator WspR
MDIDHFKQYNDNYGHQEGDACLVQISQALSSLIDAEHDLIARFGGEEFVCVVRRRNTDEVVQIAERLREAVASLKIPHEYSSVSPYVTISLGVASCKPDVQTDHSKVVALADSALYMAKSSGRNRICEMYE